MEEIFSVIVMGIIKIYINLLIINNEHFYIFNVFIVIFCFFCHRSQH